MALGVKGVEFSKMYESNFVCGGIHRFDSCENQHDVDIMFEGIVKGVLMMEGFDKRKNVNTGKPLSIQDMLSDIAIMKENVEYLVHKTNVN